MRALSIGTMVIFASYICTAQVRIEEAQQFVGQYFGSRLRACGESHMRQTASARFLIVEFRGFRHSISPQPLNEADRLNGITVKGRILVTASAVRRFAPPDGLAGVVMAKQPTWGPWTTDLGNYGRPLDLVKQNGKWSVSALYESTLLRGDLNMFAEPNVGGCDAASRYLAEQQAKLRADAEKAKAGEAKRKRDQEAAEAAAKAEEARKHLIAGFCNAVALDAHKGLTGGFKGRPDAWFLDKVAPPGFADLYRKLDPDGKAPLSSVVNGLVTEYLRRGVPPNQTCINVAGFGMNESPLHVLARQGAIDAMKTLLRQGAPIDVISSEGTLLLETPLTIAAKQCDLATVRLLVDSGADRTISVHLGHTSEEGFSTRKVTALDFAVRRRQDEEDQSRSHRGGVTDSDRASAAKTAMTCNQVLDILRK